MDTGAAQLPQIKNNMKEVNENDDFYTMDSLECIEAAIVAGCVIRRSGDTAYWGLSLNEMSKLVRTYPGLKAAHENFMDDELIQNKDGDIRFECGLVVSPWGWTLWESNSSLRDSGWCVYT